jgi:hypothetical protein
VTYSVYNLTMLINQKLRKIPGNISVALRAHLRRLELPIKVTGIIAVDLNLGEHGKVHLVAGARKLKNLLIAAGLLRAELIAGKAKHSKSLVSIFFL